MARFRLGKPPVQTSELSDEAGQHGTALPITPIPLKIPTMSNFHYVYILVDEATGTHFYIGCTEDLKSRLDKHNKGDVPHTAKFRPWRIKNAIAFDDREKAYAFEAYLKTHCGRAFSKRHF